MMRCLPALGLVFLAGTVSLSPAADAEDAKLTAYFKDFLEESFRQRPTEASALGDHRYDDKLDDIAPQARKGWLDYRRKVLTELPRKIEFQKLSRSGQIDFEIFQHHLKREIWLAENTRPFEEDPRVYNEYITGSVYQLLTQSTLDKAVNVKNAAARMRQIPKIVGIARQTLKNPPRVVVETAGAQNKGAIGFYERGVFELAGETPQLSELSAPAKLIVAGLRDYQKFLDDELLPKAKGEWRIGKEKFSQKLVLELDAGLTADQVLAEAQKEFDRVEREMYVIARQLWAATVGERGASAPREKAEPKPRGANAPRSPLPPDDPVGRRATIRLVLAHFAADHGKPEDLARDAKATVAHIKTFITKNDILRLPEPDRCQVIEMPEFQRGNSTAFLNPAPPLDPKAISVYAVSPPPRDWDDRRVRSFLEEYNRHMLQILTIHEAYPGHYVQLEYSNRHPSLIRRVLQSGIFAEGWAVYTEQMMLDQGYGNSDPVLRLHQLKWYLRAVTNAILDHKMHCTNMTDEEALKLLVEGAYQTEGEALKKIVRAKQSSCQLSTYFVGRTAFYRLRQEVQRELGDKFDLGRFHEAVLDHGTLPVKYLPELVRERLNQPR
jgi:uncharacterized protein (DUF885 family)